MAAYIYSYLIMIIIGFILSLNRQSHRLETRKLICISASIILLVIIGFRHPSMELTYNMVNLVAILVHLLQSIICHGAKS